MIDPADFSFFSEIRQELILKHSFEEKSAFLTTKIKERIHERESDSLKWKESELSEGEFLDYLSDLEPYRSEIQHFLSRASIEEQVVFYQLYLIDAGTLFPRISKEGRFSDTINVDGAAHVLLDCVSTLLEVDRFYAPIGGLIGYHVEILSQLLKMEKKLVHDGRDTEYLPPPTYVIEEDQKKFWSSVYHGTLALEHTCEFYAVGGAGDRLNLIDSITLEPRPAACLKILGKSLLHWLFDDIEAREYWHYQVTGRDLTVPLILMTSLEKKNDIQIEALLNENFWFQRDPATIFRIIQPLVPLVDQKGAWVASAPFKPALKPGGHGAIWKLAKDYGAYDWLLDKGVEDLIVRQINNPLSGMDGALLALLGQGRREKRSFGFASCPMKEGFHEGLNVLEKQSKLIVDDQGEETKAISYSLSNIEYVAFEALKKSDPELFSGRCPANVNLLYARLQSIIESVEISPFPGLIVNLKTDVEVIDPIHGKMAKRAARLESMMQNISDTFALSDASLSDARSMSNEDLKSLMPSFIQLYDRHKILSVTKRSFDPALGNGFETPVSFLYDWTISTRLLLETECSSRLPIPRSSFMDFCHKGPEFLFRYHPALGPLWKVIGQKISQITIEERSELFLSISEIEIHRLHLNGVFTIEANAVTRPLVNRASSNNQRSRTHIARAVIRNARIENRGINSEKSSLMDYVQASCIYDEKCSISMEGYSELYIEDVVIRGSFSLVVPDGKMAKVMQESDGSVKVILSDLDPVQPSWSYNVVWREEEAPQLLKVEYSLNNSL